MGTTVTFSFNGRDVIAYAPTGIAANARWIISLHAGGTYNTAWAAVAGLNAEADTGLFYVFYPNGQSAPATPNVRTWYCGNNTSYNCCGYASRARENDVEYIKELIQYIPSLYSVDTAKLFFASYSNGAFLSLSYRGVYPADIAGIVSVAGSFIGVWQEIRSGASKPITHIYGTLDDVVPPSGGYSSEINPFTGKPYLFPALDVWQQVLRTGGAVITNMALAGADHTFATINAALAPASFASITAAMVTA